MAVSATNGPRWRNHPFNRESSSPSPSPNPLMSNPRPKSAILTSPPGNLSFGVHSRNQSFSAFGGSSLAPVQVSRQRSNSSRSTNQTSSTFAPQFIKVTELQREDERVGGIEGENDFSGKRYVWLRDVQSAFIKGWVIEELDGGRLLIQCDDGSVGQISKPTSLFLDHG